MKFSATVIASGNANGVEVPGDVVEALGPAARPAVAITINGHTWRSRIAAMRGVRLIGISAANAKTAAVARGDLIEVEVQLDEEPRTVAEPDDLSAALDESPLARPAFDRLPFGLKRKHVTTIEDAKSPEVRARRIAKLVATLATPDV